MTHKWSGNWLVIGRTFYFQAHTGTTAPSLPFSRPRVHLLQPSKVGYLRAKHFHQLWNRGRKRWCKFNQVKHKLGFHTNTLCLKTSASRWSAGLSQHMSRVRSTLDTVSKAVSGTHSELLSKFSKLKPSTVKDGNKVERIPESSPQAESGAPPFSVSDTSMAPASATSDPKMQAPPTSAATVDSTTTTSFPQTTPTQPAKLLTTSDNKDQKHKQVSPASKTVVPRKLEELKPLTSEAESKNQRPKETAALFHPSTFSVHLDETYNYLAHHINSYFGSSTASQEKKVENVNASASPGVQKIDGSAPPKTSDSAVPVPAPLSKKGLGHYLSYSAPTVQAFVGSYIAPLVPKFRAGELKSTPVEVKKMEDVQAKQLDVTMNKEEKAAEEKAKKLLIQREKIIARVSVDNRTRALVQALHRATDVRVYISRVEDLSYHLLEFPETRGVAVKEKVIPCLLRLMQANDAGLSAAVREALSLVGYQKPVKGRGIRILSIDGGGLRGLLALQTLHRLETLSGKPIYKLFDYICGVSTGAILGFMLGVFQISPNECDDLYRKLGSDVFKQNVIVGTVKMGWSHAFYDSEAWEKVLKEKIGSHLLVETSRNPECPKVAAVSTIVNRGTPLKAYVFRNYNHLPTVRSHYLGGCHHQLWQAVRASSAAPGYFQEFTLGSDLHQDGGLLINNPTALAIHECKCLWPNTPLECVVSLGTGRFETAGRGSSTYTSLKTKLANVISSATNTEEVHAMLDAFLPADTYFRFNPYISEDISMDESRQEKLNLLQAEGLRYLERNEEKLKKIANILNQEKSSVQRMADWARLRADMYPGLF
ncbi:calcium-independent phospholipase A2-gamma-like isoform 1-T1 [Synchiropus picturatus]